MDLTGKVVLVTGGLGGIGKKTCHLFLTERAKVAICDVNVVDGDSTANELAVEFGSDQVLFCHTDVTCPTSFHKAMQYVKAKWGRMDILVNNAGILNESNWERMIDVNLKGMIRGCYLAWEMMGKHRGGSGGTILNVCSNLGIYPFELLPTYSASKGGAVSFTRCISRAVHYQRSGVRILGICPGKVDTQMSSDVGHWENDPEMRKKISEITQNISAMSPEDVAALIVRLIKEGENGSIWYYEKGSEPYPIKFMESDNSEYNVAHDT